MLEVRIVELETKVAYQEVQIEDLSAVLYAQQKSIDLLKAQLEALLRKLHAGQAEPEIGPANEKPPHY